MGQSPSKNNWKTGTTAVGATPSHLHIILQYVFSNFLVKVARGGEIPYSLSSFIVHYVRAVLVLAMRHHFLLLFTLWVTLSGCFCSFSTHLYSSFPPPPPPKIRRSFVIFLLPSA